ncbi:glycoside hydrolase family 20 protein [Xylariaceae sp. FL0255]|nr:glycoside hydrolase family 20 protein [Xylariaceae sp. FL0255]
MKNILNANFVPWMLYDRNALESQEPSLNSYKSYVTHLAITQTGKDTTYKPLAGQVDESYSLSVAKDGVATISAASSTGVLHALESFSQLFYQHSAGAYCYTNKVPVAITDAPEFEHRGLLFDVSRSWFPIEAIYRTIDAAAWNKLNRFHFHATDSQSWPLEIPSMPELAEKGAYAAGKTYSAADLAAIQEYAIWRGVEVIVEIDTPGHFGGAVFSHPELIVGKDVEPWSIYCAEPPCGQLKLGQAQVLNPFLDKLMGDLLPRVSPYSAYFHTGGDEVNYNLYNLDPTVKTNDSSVLDPLIQKFFDTQHARVRKAGLTPMVWEEVPSSYNVTIGKDVVVQSWLGDAAIESLTAQGFKVISSNYNYLYLDCGRGQWLNFANGAEFDTYYPFLDWCSPSKGWRLIYSYNPREGLSAEQAKLVIGAEVAGWTESIDNASIDDILWPRTSAMGEVLWSGRTDATGQNRSQVDAAPRLAEFREHMVARGVGSAIVHMPFCTQGMNGSYSRCEKLERASTKSAFIFFGLTFVLYQLYLKIDEWRRLRRLGVRATRASNPGPFGLRLVWAQVKATMQYKNLQAFRGVVADKPAYTAEANLFGRRIIFTADAENIKAILATQFHDYGKGEPFHREWKEFLGDSIFTTDGDAWHASRQLLRPQFSRERISDLDTFESHLEILFKAIANGGALDGPYQKVDLAAGNGKPLDISDLFFRYTLDVSTSFLLGKGVESLTNPREPFAEAFNEVQRIQSIRARAGPLQVLVPRKTFKRGLKVVNELCDIYIDQALRLNREELVYKTKSDSEYTFLHELASFTRDRKVIRDQLVAVLLAGRDTTAATLSWTLYELGRHPEVVRKLRQEIIDTVGLERTPTYADLKSMKYLQYVVNETLRLYPVVPFNVRLALKDTTLPRGGGPDGSQPVAVLKDTPIGYSTIVLQRRHDYYPAVTEKFPDPDVYCPDRWLHWQPKPWLYIPFNGGPRICIGQQFALTEMTYVLTRMFQKFERVETFMHEIDGGDPALKTEIVIIPGQGVKIALWEATK